MGIKQKAMKASTKLLKTAIRIFGGRKAAVISAQLAEEIVPVIKINTAYGDLSFYCPGRITEWRVRTLLTKEPKTIAWINTFNPSDILWDIGANIGTYSLYAALRDISVFSIEPSPGNYYLLSKNIEINKMDNRISAICLAFNDTTKLDYLYMSNSELSGANHSFAEEVDYQGNPYNATFKQAMIGFSIDSFIKLFNPPFPSHIKIDVDGIESKIIEGAKKTISDPRLKSVLVELDVERTDYCNEVIRIMEEAGLQLNKNGNTSMINPSSEPNFDNYLFNFIRS